MSEKNTMIFYYDWLNLFDELSTAEIGELILAAVQYDQFGTDTEFKDRGLRVAFKALKNSIDISNEKYQEISEKRRKAIEKRWKEHHTNEYKSIQKNSNEDFVSYTDTDTETDTDIDTVTDTKTDTETDTDTDTDTESGGGGIEPPPPPLTEEEQSSIIDSWNRQSCTQNIKSLFPKNRMNNALKCIGSNFDQFYWTIINLDRQQYFIRQANNGKPVTFDWFVQPDNYQKVLEGNYAKTYGSEGGNGGLKFGW